MERKCCGCGLLKDISLFEKDPNKKYGRNYRCRECARERYNPEYHREYRKKHQKRINTLIGDWKKKRSRDSVYAATAHAVKSGKIKKQPCVICGHKISQAHHEDYSKPLNVVWLCRRHHIALHTS